MLYSNMGSPPIADYEQVVRPVAVTVRGSALHEQDRRDAAARKRKLRKRPKSHEPEDDLLFEPFLGKLFDYSA